MEEKSPNGATLYHAAKVLMETNSVTRVVACEKVGLDLNLFDYYRKKENREKKKAAAE